MEKPQFVRKTGTNLTWGLNEPSICLPAANLELKRKADRGLVIIQMFTNFLKSFLSVHDLSYLRDTEYKILSINIFMAQFLTSKPDKLHNFSDIQNLLFNCLESPLLVNLWNTITLQPLKWILMRRKAALCWIATLYSCEVLKPFVCHTLLIQSRCPKPPFRRQNQLIHGDRVNSWRVTGVHRVCAI